MTMPIAPAGPRAGATIIADGVTAPSPAYSGVFIPELWSGKLIEKFYDSTVLAAIANTDYEGEISNFGDTVNIRTKPTIEIKDYAAYAKLEIDSPSSTPTTLDINQGKYFNTILDDVMEIQSDVDHLSMWADDAAEQMKIKIDTDILADIVDTQYSISNSIDAANKGATAGAISGNIDLGVTTSAIAITQNNVLDKIVELGQCLDEQNIPETGRWIVIPAWFASKIKRSELRDASLTSEGVSMARNGRLGMIDRFTLYSSNLLKHVDDTTECFSVLAGHSHGLTFAAQLTKVETLRAETTFGTLMRGLQVYGAEIVDGTAICELYCTDGGFA